MQEQLMRNPEMMRQVMNSPMMENFLNNPQLMQNMLTNNPQMQAMLDANPQMRHILNDPAVRRKIRSLYASIVFKVVSLCKIVFVLYVLQGSAPVYGDDAQSKRHAGGYAQSRPTDESAGKPPGRL
jgi:hypothetical protein